MTRVCRRVMCRDARAALTVMRNHLRRMATTPCHKERRNAKMLLAIYGTPADRARFVEAAVGSSR